MLELQDDYGVKEAHPTKRSLSILASRRNIIHQNIPECKTKIPNTQDIPRGINYLCEIPGATRKRGKGNDLVEENCVVKHQLIIIETVLREMEKDDNNSVIDLEQHYDEINRINDEEEIVI